MKLNVEFSRPQNLQQALEILSQDPATRVIAGGTDVIPGFLQGSPRFSHTKRLVDVHHLPELRRVQPAAGGLSIGAAATFAEIAVNPLIHRDYPLLAQAAAGIGSAQIRNRATLAGNFVNNAPCADSVPALLAYNAEIRIQALNGERRLPLGDFLLQPYKTQLQPGELVIEIHLPPLPAGLVGEFYKLGRRRHVNISRITLAALLKLERDTAPASSLQDRNMPPPIIVELRLASGAVTPIGERLWAIETFARGRLCTPEVQKEIAQELGRIVLEKTGLRWSSAYKLPVLQQTFYQLLRRLGNSI